MSDDVAVTIHIPRYQYRALLKAAIAIDPNMQVRALIESRIEVAFKPSQAAIARRNRAAVAALHAEGLNDREIADRLHLHQQTVWDHRNALGLKKNTRKGRKPATKPKESNYS